MISQFINLTRPRIAPMAAENDEILMVARKFADPVNDNLPATEEMALEHDELIAHHEECAKAYQKKLEKKLYNLLDARQ